MENSGLYILFGGGSLLLSTVTMVGGYIYGGKKKKDVDECERNRASCQSDFKNSLRDMRDEDRKVHDKLFDLARETNKEVSEIAGGLRSQGFIK